MNQVHFAKPPLTFVNKIIIIISVSCFLISSVLNLTGMPDWLSFLALDSKRFLSGFLFQIITYPFVQKSLISVLFNSLLLWFVGGELEEKWGRKTYLKFLFISVLGAGAVFVLLAFFFQGSFAVLSGLDGINLSLLVAYGVIYSERMMSFMLIFPMKAKYFCLLLAGMQLYLGIFSSHRFSSWAHITAMLWGYLFLKGKSLSIKRAEKKRKSHLRLVSKEDSERDPRYFQ